MNHLLTANKIAKVLPTAIAIAMLQKDIDKFKKCGCPGCKDDLKASLVLLVMNLDEQLTDERIRKYQQWMDMMPVAN